MIYIAPKPQRESKIGRQGHLPLSTFGAVTKRIRTHWQAAKGQDRQTNCVSSEDVCMKKVFEIDKD